MNTPSQAEFADSAAAAASAESTVPPPAPSARATLKALQDRFAVFRDCLPLAIGIDKQVQAAQPGLDRKTLRAALRMHTGSLRYLKSMEKATQRFDLAGAAVADVTDEHRAHAAETLKERFRKEADLKRAKAAAEREAQAAEQRAQKLNQLAAKFAKR